MTKDHKNLISIGDLANLYTISKRTLRLYHEMGLLVPCYMDETTGYRYYSPSQRLKLVDILQLRNAGVSLVNIKTIMEEKDTPRMESILVSRLDELDRQIADLKTQRRSLEKFLNSCEQFQNPPLLEHIFVSYIPRRTVYICDIEKYDMTRSYEDGAPWLAACNRMVAVFKEREAPAALMHLVSCIVDMDSMLTDRPMLSGAVLFLDDNVDNALPKTILKGGAFVCMYIEYQTMDNIAEYRALKTLRSYIAERGYKITGPCIFEMIAAQMSDDKGVLVKAQIPVELPTDA